MTGAGGDARGSHLPHAVGRPAAYLLRAVRGEERGPWARALCAGLRVLSWLYLAALGLLAAPYRWGWRRRRRAPCPVVSVGNLSLGGTGKSTVAAALAGWLVDAGYRPAILSRGYRARRRQAVAVVSDGGSVRLGPGEGGDEPVMLARRLAGVPVLIGPRRPLAARAACELGADVCILDDGLQVRNLERDLEIVLLDSVHPFDGGFVLPRGLLREPPAHLSRADVVVLMEPQRLAPGALGALRRRVRSLAPRALLAEARRAPARLWNLADGGEAPLSTLRGARVAAVSGIGNPQGFEQLLEDLGAVVHPMRRPDHHHYSEADLARILEEARLSGAAAIVTTDKDAVKLAALCAEPSAGPAPAACPARRGPAAGLPLAPWGVKGGSAGPSSLITPYPNSPTPTSPAGRALPAPGLAHRLAAHGAPPLLVLSIRLEFLADEAAVRERVLATAARGARGARDPREEGARG